MAETIERRKLTDHDLLIVVDTKMDMLMSQLSGFPSKESVDTLKEELTRVRNKSNQYDILLAIATSIGIIVSILAT